MTLPLIDIIEQYDSICIFRHTNPDGDALGSQWGLAQFIRDNYPKKKVYVVGENNPSASLSLFPIANEVSEAVLKESLSIVLDSATQERIDGDATLGKAMVNVDHHPGESHYGDYQFVDSTRSSTCELLIDMLKDKGTVSKEAATYFLAGMLTDSLSFTVEATKARTLYLASYLMECGANITDLSARLFNRSYLNFKTKTYLATFVEFEDGLASLLVTKAMRDELNISSVTAKLLYSIMANVSDFEIWMIAVETDEGDYIGSVRSRNVTINEICSRFNGGGHRLACGVKDLTLVQVEELKKELIKAIKETL